MRGFMRIDAFNNFRHNWSNRIIRADPHDYSLNHIGIVVGVKMRRYIFIIKIILYQKAQNQMDIIQIKLRLGGSFKLLIVL